MTIVIFVLFLSLPFLVDYAYMHMEFVFIRSTWTIFVIVFRFMLFSNTSVRFLLPDSMTDNDIVNLLKETEHNDYPVVLPWESQYLVGFVLQRDLNLTIGENGTGNKKQSNEHVISMCFTLYRKCKTFHWWNQWTINCFVLVDGDCSKYK